jgi:hypothetical protein
MSVIIKDRICSEAIKKDGCTQVTLVQTSLPKKPFRLCAVRFLPFGRSDTWDRPL